MPIRILVVDDATFIRDMMKKHLRERIAGAEILDACDGNRAIAILKQNSVDLIMSDWEMPDMNGEEFLRWVRGEEQYKTIPFVMVSSRGDRDHVVKAVEAGVSDYLSKPFTPDELVKKAVKQLHKIGIDTKVKFGRAAAGNQGHAFASIDVLTGAEKPAGKNKEDAVKKSSTENNVAPLQVSGAPPKSTPANNDGKRKFTGAAEARLRFANAAYACTVQDISLQALNGSFVRNENAPLPALFDQAAVDLVTEDGEDIARINAYVHSLQAVENHINSGTIKVVVRYVDNDPKKMEVLSKFISRFRK